MLGDRHGRHPRSGRKALRLQPHRLRKFARKGLVSDDERELHDLWFREMLAKPCEALFRYVQVVAGDPLAEVERRPLALTVARAVAVPEDVGEFLRRDTLPHADGVTDIHSIRRTIERGDLHVEQRAKLAVDLPEPLDGAVEAADPEHEWWPVSQRVGGPEGSTGTDGTQTH